MRDDDHLFGQEGDEILYDDPETVIEHYMGNFEPEDRQPFDIEEWTVAPATAWLPTAVTIADDILDRAAEDTIDEFCFADYERAVRSDDVTEALNRALLLIASKVHYRMADKRVATHRVTFNLLAQPLLNGERVFP